jgi:heptaprenyl diphosphate synthase
MKLKMLYSYLNADLTYIEKEIENSIQSHSNILNEASLQLLQAGGKRIRPVFVLLGGQFGSYNIESLKNVAVTLELIHMATLVHDDVIDDSMLRRGKPTIKAQWDNKVAIYTGDYILALSLEVMSKIQNEMAHKILADTLIEVCLGEIEQIKDKYRFDQSMKDYFRRIKRKTALLIAISCQLGGICSGVEEKIHKLLYKYGYYVGMAFQITDDILDFVGTEKDLGKPAGSDLLQGNITLPVLLAMKDDDLRKDILKVNEYTTKDEMKRLIDRIKATDVIEQSRNISDKYLQKALNVLDELPNIRARKVLKDIALFIGKRKF